MTVDIDKVSVSVYIDIVWKWQIDLQYLAVSTVISEIFHYCVVDLDPVRVSWAIVGLLTAIH